MAQTAIATFEKSGHWVRVSEVEILSTFGTLVEERRYIVFSKAPGKPLRESFYSGPDAKRRAIEQFDFAKSCIELNQ